MPYPCLMRVPCRRIRSGGSVTTVHENASTVIAIDADLALEYRPSNVFHLLHCTELCRVRGIGCIGSQVPCAPAPDHELGVRVPIWNDTEKI